MMDRRGTYLTRLNPGPCRAVGLSVALALLPVAAAAEEQDGKLRVTSTAYLWATSLNGQQALFGLPVSDVELSFGDIIDKVDIAAAGIVEVRGDQFGFVGEINYVKLTADATGPGGVLTGDLDSRAFFALAAATYRVADEDWGHVDLIGGLKHFRFKNALVLSPGPVSASDSQSFTDVTVGAKAAFPLAERWQLVTWAMAGAGGSDLTWDVLAAFDYRISERWSASFGYRAMGVDYSSGGFSYDMTQRGPIIGVTARF